MALPDKLQNHDPSTGRFLPGNSVPRYSEEDLEGLFQAYLVHRSYAYDKKSFYPCDYRTIEKWTVLHPIKGEQLRAAEARGRLYFEQLLLRAALGLSDDNWNNPITGKKEMFSAKKVNTTLLIFLMKSKFRDTYGDKVEIDQTTTGEQKYHHVFQVIAGDKLIDLSNIGAEMAPESKNSYTESD